MTSPLLTHVGPAPAVPEWRRPEARILHLIASNFVGGPEKQILAHAALARRAGCDIRIGSFGATEILARAAEQAMPTVELHTSAFVLPACVSELADRVRTEKISLLVTYGYKADIVGWLASRRTGARQLAFVRGWTAEDWKVALYEGADRYVVRRVANVACVSREQAEVASAGRGTLPAPVVIPNAALTSGAVASFRDRREARQALRIPPDAFVVGAVGRLSPEKGHRYLIDGILQFGNEVPYALVVIVGDGPERSALETQVREWGLQDKVQFAGFQKNVPDWMLAMDVLVNPSLREGMPNAVLEAMAAGLPVVATAVGGLPEMITHGQSGMLVPPADGKALADTLRELFQHPEQRTRLAEGARRRAAELSPEAQCALLFAAYEEALRGRA